MSVILVLGRLRQDSYSWGLGNLATDSHSDLQCDPQTWYTMKTPMPTKNSVESRARSHATICCPPPSFSGLSSSFQVAQLMETISSGALCQRLLVRCLNYAISHLHQSAQRNEQSFLLDCRTANWRHGFSEMKARAKKPQGKQQSFVFTEGSERALIWVFYAAMPTWVKVPFPLCSHCKRLLHPSL